MIRIFKITSLLLIIIFMISCASTYKSIMPQSINYSAHDFQDNINVSYKYDVLSERGNRKYSRKEEKKNVKLVAIQITNNTDSVIIIGENAIFYSGQNQIFPMEPLAIKNSIQQIVPAYLPYLILTFLQLNINDGTTSESYPIGIVVGPSVTIGNMAMAHKANMNLYNELLEYNLLNKIIKKGETVYGIIGLRDFGYEPIYLKLRN